MHAQWDIGWLIWVIALAAATLACALVAAGAGLTWLRQGTQHAYTMSGLTFVLAVAGVLLFGAIGTTVTFPFSGQYHRFVPKSGTVTRISSRFLASGTQGGGTTQKYVVTFRGGQTFGCLDTRCANVGVGDHLTLMCERVFQFNSPYEGWDCNWGADRKPDGTVIP